MTDGPWEASIPEEGDKIDQSVHVCHIDFDGYEVIELTKGSLKDKIGAARILTQILNTYGGKLKP